MKDVFEAIEPALSLALQLSSGGEESRKTGLARKAGLAREALLACRAYLELQRPPVTRAYSAARLVEEQVGPRMAAQAELGVEDVPECVGDPEQIVECVLILLGAVELEADAGVIVEVFSEKDVPRIQINLDGPGQFRDPLCVGGIIELSLEALAERWTLATNGGRIDRTPNGFDLRLKGVRVVPQPVVGLEEIAARIREAEQRLHLALDPPEGRLEEPPDQMIAAARAAIHAALDLVDGGMARKEPADVATALAEGVKRCREAVERRSITIEALCEPGIPPITIARKRMVSFFANALRHGGQTLSRGGSVSILVDYNKDQRAVEAVMSIVGTQYEHRETGYFASMRRTAVDVHGGTFDLAPEKAGLTATASFPDTVGRALAEWIPGFDVFTEQSNKMLRLLKSGGPTPPEDFILGGVLETELEAWLLPKLSEPPAVNIAHDLKANNKDLPGSSNERLTKALGQLQRGKPRKEIAKPAYAAEILWAFRNDARHRAAVGAERLTAEELSRFCMVLLRQPVDYTGALRTIAKARRRDG